MILSQAKTERCCLFTGPILDPKDGIFRGSGASGPITVQIPRSYWKVVIALKDGALQAFAFVLQQDLDDVSFEARFRECAPVDDPRTLEFLPTPEWKRLMVPLRSIETSLGDLIRFPPVLHTADQFPVSAGVELAMALRLDRKV